MSALEKAIAELVALGVDGVRAAEIPPAVAQECARRWLADAARDAERVRARAVELEAEKATAAGYRRRQDDLRSAREASTARLRAERGAESSARAAKMRLLDSHVEFKSATGDRRAWAEAQYGWAVVSDYLRSSGGIAEWDRVRDEQRARWAEEDAELAERRAANERRTREAVDAIIEERARDLGMEWTSALLSTSVALPDGSRISWGEATVAQHTARLEMLTKHAATELASASRHRAAIDAIVGAGVTCLDELVSVAA